MALTDTYQPGTITIDCLNNGYKKVQSDPNLTFNGGGLVFHIDELPTLPGGNAQMWVMDSTPTGAVDRIGFEYKADDDQLIVYGQTNTPYDYADISGNRVVIENYSTDNRKWLGLAFNGYQVTWHMSVDGLAWETVRTWVADLPWVNENDLMVSFEGNRTAGNDIDQFTVSSVNVLPTAGPAQPVANDELQQRTLDEVRAWEKWLSDNDAQGWVGEFATVTKWGEYNEPTQQTKWDELLDVYLSELDYAGLDGTYWSSGREFDAGYPLGELMPAEKGQALSVVHGTNDVLAAHTGGDRRQGYNLAGHETGIDINGGGTVRDTAPLIHSAADFKFLADNGVTLIRLPLSWERMQAALYGPLDADAMKQVELMVYRAGRNGIDVILDVHNYGRYTNADGSVSTLGYDIDSYELGQLWELISDWVRADNARNATVVGYGLMNEPHDFDGGAETWESISQKTLTAIRNNGDDRLVLVAGYQYSNLYHWAENHGTGWIVDPAGNFRYEAHHYWDTQTYNPDGSAAPRSGQYQQYRDGARSTMTYWTELDAAQGNPPPPPDPEPEEYSGSGSTGSTSTGSGTETGSHVGTGSTGSSSHPTGSGTAGRAGSGLPSEGRSDGGGTGTAIHAGSGHTDSLSAITGDGRQVHGGTAESGSSGDGSGAADHAGSGSVESGDDGTSSSSSDHAGTGEPVTSGSSGEGTETTGRYGDGIEVGSDSSGSGTGYARQIGTAGITRPIVGVTIRLIDEDGNPGEFLPDWTQVAFTDKYNATGTVAFDYAKDGLRYREIRRSRAEGALFDGLTEIPNTRFLITQSSTDGVKEDESGHTVTINAPLYVPTRLSEATVYPPDGIDGANTKTQFSATTPGSIIGRLIAKAKDRGAISEIVQNFSAERDSAGNSWEKLVTLEVDSGGSVQSVLEKLTEMGVCDWTSDGRELRLLNPDSGADLTEVDDPIILQSGRDMLDAPEKWDGGNPYTHVLVVGKDGITVQVPEPSNDTHVGPRVEGYISVSGVDDKGTLRVIGEKTLAKAQLETESYTHGLALFSNEGPHPYVDFVVGDYLYRDVADGELPRRFRVAQLSATYSQTGMVAGAVTLGTRFDTTAQRLQAQIDALTNGSDGTSAPADSPIEDTTPPKTPEGLLVNSDAYMVEGGGTLAAVVADWSPVTENVDGSPLRDFGTYEVRWQITGQSFWTSAGAPNDPHLTWSPVPTQTQIAVQVRAGDRFGNWSPWSDSYLHNTAYDDIPPKVPSAPVISSYLGTLRADWDGLGADGGSMDADLLGANVEYTADRFGEWERVDRLPAKGRTVITGLEYGKTYYVRLIAEDWSHNYSDPSDTGSGVPQQVVNVDLGPDAVDSEQIRELAVGRAQIADLAVNNAKIADLDVGKLTAGLMTADVTIAGSFNTSDDPDNRVRMDSGGLHMTSGGDQRVFIEPDGTALFAGEVRTANSGMRLVWNANQSSPSIQFHSNGTNEYTAPSLYVAADNVNTTKPAVILDGPLCGNRGPYNEELVIGVVVGDKVSYLGVRGRAANNAAAYEGFYVEQNGRTYVRTSGGVDKFEARTYRDTGYSEVHGFRFERHDGQSHRWMKRDITELPTSALDFVENAPVLRWRYNELGPKGASDDFQLGPMLDDMPEWFRKDDDSYNRDDIAFIAYEAVRELSEKVRELENGR